MSRLSGKRIRAGFWILCLVAMGRAVPATARTSAPVVKLSVSSFINPACETQHEHTQNEIRQIGRTDTDTDTDNRVSGCRAKYTTDGPGCLAEKRF